MMVLFFFILMCNMCMLQGCVAALVASTAVAAQVINDPRTIGAQVDDETLEYRVTRALYKDKQMQKMTHIVATAYQGKVLLTGQVVDKQLRQHAKEIAMGVKGINGVYNEIRIKKISLDTNSFDSWISTKVRSQFFSNKRVKFSHVKVHTESGEVFLLGLVTNEEANILENIAKHVHGVKHVTRVFTILN
ncbi:division/outer membrane stress-associated lipid-binding lipoprotein [Candidatus Erwinia haradaeae]|uniref:Uncharacterized protein YraP n=1 Tax=Candidatus Erwinia haradaeae TaxID=1922217 RepID=A0A803FTY4_9GAMM|nr:division/outer membrane stress-associated lipid-binding lipoprotein [Candidatus Erwinia haradaeae]VFP88388.1 Uncharacterized protein YraP [Candidatus Erwinia haradaeae]